MKNRLLILLAVFLTTSLAGCRIRVPETYQLLHPENEIAHVYIVNAYIDDANELVQTERCEINDIVGFLNDFRKVPCYVYFGDPVGPIRSGEATDIIKIVYENGDYELIDYNGQAEYTQTRGYDHYTGFSIFDKEKCYSLVSDYLSN